MGTAPDYGRVAKVYDFLVNIYSMGQTRVSKASQIRKIQPGDRVLIAGAGAGTDVVEAARRGAKVTVVELAAPMVDVIRERLDKSGLLDRAELIVGDILQHKVSGHQRYDIVTANFLLPVFDKDRWPDVLRHLTQLIKPGGKLLIADFAPIRGPSAMRMLQAAYYAIGNFSVGLTAGNTLHRR